MRRERSEGGAHVKKSKFGQKWSKKVNFRGCTCQKLNNFKNTPPPNEVNAVRWNRHLVRCRTIVRRCIILRRLALPPSHRTTSYYNATILFKTLFFNWKQTVRNIQSKLRARSMLGFLTSEFTPAELWILTSLSSSQYILDISYLTTSNV